MKSTFKDGHTIAVSVAREFQARNPNLNFDDIYQEAWCGILGAKRCDEKLASEKTYLSNAARNAVMNYVFKFKVVFSGSNYRNRDAVSVMKQEKTGKILEICHNQKSAEDSVQDAQARAQIKGVLKKLGYDEAKTKWIAAILLGEYRAREIAEALSMDVTKVYETIKDTKKRLKRSTLLKQMYE